MTTAPGRAETVDAVVVGGGHHGLVAATLLADAGWDVVVCEARDKAGGAVASRRVDGWVLDEYSAFYPLAKASPALASLDLTSHGLRWAERDAVVAHVAASDDGVGTVLWRDPARTAATLEADHPGDGDAWLGLVAGFERVREPLLAALLTQWPPTTSALALLRRVGLRDAPDFARMLALPLEAFTRERFGGRRAADLLAGNALHADIPLTSPGSGLFGWLMAMLAQTYGFPAPVGGAGELARALVRRAEASGARVRLSSPVERVDVRGGRAIGVRLRGGGTLRARRAVICDTSAPDLYDRLLAPGVVPAGLRARLDRFRWDPPTLKLNWRLAAPLPWTAAGARTAPVVHAGLDADSLARWSDDVATGRSPGRPFALVGQMTTADPSRSPAGTESLWLYTRLPRGAGSGASEEAVRRCEEMLDRLAPGWRDAVLDRWAQTPDDLHAADANLGDGALAGGTNQLFQQAFWRPVTGLGGPRTFVEGLFLGSAAIHPGGGVHGAAGLLAARAALADAGWLGGPRRRLATAALRGLYRRPPAY
ncbi:phytoene desaturase family protein [Nigerium massiliense]|uniref:phytoene desaturase family protein n=1 Tax=Nigerium massiliense TaxID=1522317 RepID=UPI0005902853|nr:NAD(P)/FAD-dependent oxidoreductase [Nigerium massiliense]